MRQYDAQFLPFSTATSTAASPAYPDGTVDVTNYTGAGHNPLALTYPHPSSIPGLFKLEGDFSNMQPGGGSDTGRIFIAATKASGKTLAFGSVYSWRQAETNFVNTGAFILFEQ